MLSEAKDLSRPAQRCFASLSMTALNLSVAEELSRSFEPCLKTHNRPLRVAGLFYPCALISSGRNVVTSLAGKEVWGTSIQAPPQNSNWTYYCRQ